MTAEPVPLRALVLEDSQNDTALLVSHLRHAGYALSWRRADNAQDLRAALADGTWDVVLADYSMPQFTAPAALAIVKEYGLDVPFIIISGSVGEAAAVDAMKAGAHDFFLKGNLARLASAVERERRDACVRNERRQGILELQENQERLRDAVRARDEFLAIASHELKTPLTSLSLQVESTQQLLGELVGPAVPVEKLGEKLACVSLQVARLKSLINNLLDVARITSKRMALSPETFDLRQAVDTVREGTRELLARSGSTLVIRAGTPVVGEWDRAALESVIGSLVSNAILYGAGKPIEIDIDIRADQARMVFVDHGIGISVEDRDRIFSRFERAVPQQHFGGFGLGLWVAREIVGAHCGTITVESTLGSGSTFTVLLPLGTGVGAQA